MSRWYLKGADKYLDMDATKGILLTCQHCYNTWRYKGKSKHYATCTRCYYKVKVPKR